MTARARPAASLLLLLLVLAPRAQAAPSKVPDPTPRLPDGAWRDALRGRPRLIGPREHLRALSRERPEAYRAITRMDDSLLARGVVHAVDGLSPDALEPWLERARRHVARGPTNVHQDSWLAMRDVALTYDLFHDAIPEGERRSWVEFLNGHLGVFTQDEGAFHNSTLSKILTYLQVAWATWGENPRAPEFRAYAVERLYEGRVVPVLRALGQGGGFTEGGWYTRSSLWHLVQALELARRLEGYRGFELAPRFFYQRLAYELHQPYPGLWREGYGAERYAPEGDASDVFGGHNEYPRHTRTVLAQLFRGSDLARAVSLRRRRGANAEARLVDLLWDEEPEPAAGAKPGDLGELPLAHLASGIGRLYARGDWSDDATWLRFECGDYFSGHQHFDVGHLEIFRREPLATESGEYHDYLSNHSVNWLLRTVAHNCVLVHDPDEVWTRLRDGGKHRYANDGGQAKRWEHTVDTLEEWQAARERFERGDVIAYQDHPGLLYVAGDCTPAYSPEKLALWVRQVVFLRPHTIVVLDRVVSRRPDQAKAWLLHSREEPVVDGATATITHGEGRLVVRTLLPENARLATVEGYTYGGETFDPPKNAQTPVANRWRLEVRPARPAAEDAFLHVLFTDAPQPVRLLRGSGVRVKVGEVELRFEGRVGGTVEAGGRKVKLEPRVRLGRFED